MCKGCVNFVCDTEPRLLRRFLGLGLRTQPLLTMLFLWRLRPWLLMTICLALCLSVESDDSGSSIAWTEESSDEDLDYFAALDVAATEPSPRAEGSEEPPCASTGYRWRRAVAKRRVSGLL